MKICRHLLLQSECYWCHLEAEMQAKSGGRWLVTAAVVLIVSAIAGWYGGEMLGRWFR